MTAEFQVFSFQAVGMWGCTCVVQRETMCNYLLASLDENRDTADKIRPDVS